MQRTLCMESVINGSHILSTDRCVYINHTRYIMYIYIYNNMCFLQFSDGLQVMLIQFLHFMALSSHVPRPKPLRYQRDGNRVNLSLCSEIGNHKHHPNKDWFLITNLPTPSNTYVYPQNPANKNMTCQKTEHVAWLPGRIALQNDSESFGLNMLL